MKFTITTSGHFYSSESRREELEEIGFKFEPFDSNIGPIQSNDQSFIIQGTPTIEIKSLEDLIEFSNKWGEIIVSDGNIKIYDSYRE